MASGLILFFYIGAHLFNHALGLVSLDAAEAGMAIGVEVWYSPTGTIVLYGAAATHFLLALWAVYERRTFRLPPAELLRIALGFTLPIVLIGHAVATRIGCEMFGLSSDYTRVISHLFASNSEVWQLGVMAPGWLHGCLGLHLAFSRRAWYRRLRYVLFAVALLLPVLSALGFIVMGRQISARTRRPPQSVARIHEPGQHRAASVAVELARRHRDRVFLHYRRGLRRARASQFSGAAEPASGLDFIPGTDRRACRATGPCWKRAAASICRTPRCAADGRAARPAASA